MTRNDFAKKIIKDIKELGYPCHLENQRFYFIKHGVAHSGSIDMLYRLFQQCPSYGFFWNYFKEEFILSQTKLADMNSIYPVLMNKRLYESIGCNTIAKEDFICNLFVAYLDTGVGVNGSFILRDSYKRIPNIKEIAFNNLERIIGLQNKIFVEVNGYSEIYGVHGSLNPIIPTFIFSPLYQKKVIEKVGVEFIFAFPTNKSLVFSSNSKENSRKISSYMDQVALTERVFPRMYLYKKGKYSIFK